jgi:hypothetical protein
VDVVMRQVRRAEEKLFVDFPGDRIPIYSCDAGGVGLEAELFVAVAGGARAVHVTLAAGEAAFLQLTRREEVAMLEEYFVEPETVDRIRTSWAGPELERYVAWCSAPRSGLACSV